MPRSLVQRLTCVWLATTLAFGGCRATTAPKSSPKRPVATATATTPPAPSSPSGRRAVDFEPTAVAGALSIELVDGAALAAPATTTELSANETTALLARLEPLPELANAGAPTLRAPSPPPPRAGAVTPIAFAVTHGKPAGDPGPARPVAPAVKSMVKPEISPSGDIDKETEIRVRFSDAMVPVAAVGTSDKPIATITPAVAGTWRWLDTRVATFKSAAAYFPNATEFTVTVPTGTKALDGTTLAEPAVQTFRTRPLTLIGTFPTGPVRPDSAIAVQLDQAFDRDALLPFLRVLHAKRALPYRVITRVEAEALWRKNPSIDLGDLDTKLGKHHLLIAPQTAWTAGVAPQIELAKNAPSKEGPVRTKDESYAGFTVVPPFRVAGIACDEGYVPRMTGRACPMRGYVNVELTNPIAATTYRSKMIQLEGDEFQDHEPYGSHVSLLVPDGVGRVRHVAIAPDFMDIYGQPLGGPRRPSFTVARQRFEPFVSTPTGLVTLDPRWRSPQWIVTAEEVTALHVQLFQVSPADYLAYEAFERRERATPPGKKVLDRFYPIGARHGGTLRTDLGPHLGAHGTGHLVAVVHAQPARPHRAWTAKQSAWLQVTKLGTSARVDGQRMHAYVHDVGPGNFLKPIANARLAITVEGRTDTTSAATDAQGYAALDLAATPTKWTNDQRAPTVVLGIQTATDSAIATYHGRHERARRHESARWYVTDDRFMYKPGEKVYVKGWVRWTHDGIDPDLALPAASDTVQWTLADNRGNKLASGTAALSDHGGFDVEADLPANANQGHATFTFMTRTSSVRHPIQVQEFRRPAYAVNLDEDVTHSGAAHLVLGEAIEMRATAKYYAGGGLPGAGLDWTAMLEPATYAPPGWSMYTFEPKHQGARRIEAYKNHTLSGESSATAVFGIEALPAKRPAVLEVDATVTDVDRMTIRATSRKILVHPSTLYVGARLQPRSHDVLELVVTDIDGNLVPDVPIDVEINGVLWSERNRTDQAVIDKQRCALRSARAPVTCHVKRKGLDYVYSTVTTVADSRAREASTTFTLPWWSRERDQHLGIVADKKSYRPGDVAKLAIKSQQVPAVAVVSFARNGVIAQRRIELAKTETTVEVPIEPGWLQNVHVLVDRWADRRPGYKHGDPPLPEVLSTALDLPVEVESARLAMRTRPIAKLVEPGAKATFEVEVLHDGAPKPNAEVALIVVDEAVLALTGKHHADPLEPFYRSVGHGTYQFDSVDRIRDDGEHFGFAPGFSRYNLDERGIGGGGSGSGYGTLGMGRYGTIGHGGGTGGPVISRKDFRATAAFSPLLKTDAHGKVRLTVTMPDSLTRFRIVALATSDTRFFGKAESAIVTQRKVNARTVAPRFLNQGDAFSLPVVVQNLDTAPRTIDVAARAANLVAVGPAGKRVTLQGGQRAEVRFDFRTAERGKAVVQTIAVSGHFADASNVDIPVYEPATTEAFATYGVVDDAPTFERLEVPADIFPDVGGVELELASTQLQSLTDAYWYLYAYPYECAEQRSSRMIATAAMTDILDAFQTPGRPTKQEIADTARTDLAKLAKQQNPDGGWGYFGGMKSDPFVTAQVLVALGAHRADPRVVGKATKLVRAELDRVTARLDAAAAKPAIDRHDRAYHGAAVSLAAALLTALAKTDVTARAERLHATATALGAYPIDAKARVLSLVANLPRAKAVREKLLADLLSATHETASAATVTTQYAEDERALLVSSTKTTALALDAIMREAPAHSLVPKLARGVLGTQTRGRWSSTQENLVVLQTMRRYFDTYEKTTPNYTGRAWFGAAAYTEATFAGHSSTRGVAQVTWDRLPAKSGHDLALQKTGPGRMYYRIGITYAPKQLDLPALDAGFVVRRTYEAIDDASDVIKGPTGYRIRLGARVRVTLEVINSTRRHAVALVDPLPAGFEAVNEALATAERTVRAHGDAHWDFRAHRDTRVEAFRMELPAGRHRYTYTARATTPGTFVAAPVKAEEMYSPETFGRGTGFVVVVE